MEVISPQKGKQEMFLSCPADICIFGGGAGGGKTLGLLLDFLRGVDDPKFNGVFFRRTTPQIKSAGGPWQTALSLYRKLGANPKETTNEIIFPKGATLKMSHLEDDAAVHNWQGAQICYLMFDELCHFTENQFWYLFSRLRSDCSIRPTVRCTCNPDPNSFVRKLIDWYIKPDGYADEERCGKIRWFIRQEDALIWGDTREELVEKYGQECLPLSFTFISSLVHDNKILLKNSPNYLAALNALDKVTREQLLKGNWNIKPSAGNYFKARYFEIIDALPANALKAVRAWDRASRKPSPEYPDPDFTAGVKLIKYSNNIFVIADVQKFRGAPLEVETVIKNTASRDGFKTNIIAQQDPGSAGVQEAQLFTRMLAGYVVKTKTLNKDKVTRAKACSAQAEAGNIKILRAPWNEDFLKELESFPEGNHDDGVDALSLAFNELTQDISLFDCL